MIQRRAAGAGLYAAGITGRVAQHLADRLDPVRLAVVADEPEKWAAKCPTSAEGTLVYNSFCEIAKGNTPMIRDFDELMRQLAGHADEILAQGVAIVYQDPEYPGEIVKEHPDGRRQIVDCYVDGQAFVVRNIEPRIK